ncbi:hypothetical protein AA3271_1272 [Gluconobacter japonicus NBRC 3271]|nr:hypothetical protein AA3271_1272 [Gluconobacter japonicus NBRC 3271]
MAIIRYRTVQFVDDIGPRFGWMKDDVSGACAFTCWYAVDKPKVPLVKTKNENTVQTFVWDIQEAFCGIECYAMRMGAMLFDPVRATLSRECCR